MRGQGCLLVWPWNNTLQVCIPKFGMQSYTALPANVTEGDIAVLVDKNLSSRPLCC